MILLPCLCTASLLFWTQIPESQKIRTMVQKPGVPESPVLCVSYFQCGRAMRVDRVFCCAAVTHLGMLCGQKETALPDSKHPYISFLFLTGFISQKKGQEKEGKR